MFKKNRTVTEVVRTIRYILLRICKSTKFVDNRMTVVLVEIQTKEKRHVFHLRNGRNS